MRYKSPQKAALITGAARRIGRAMALDLAREGYRIAVHYHHSRAEALQVVDEITQMGGVATAIGCDLNDESSTFNLISQANSALGPLGILINNASVFEDDVIGSDDANLWHRHFQVHVRTPGILASGFADQLSDGHEGLIVNIIDQRVLKPNPNFHSYTLSKSALWTATRTMAQELAPRIRVNAIGPGPTLPSKRQNEQQFERQVDALPLKTAPDLASFARTVLFFAATQSVTGQMIALDGGQHLAWQTDDLKIDE